MAGLEAWAAVGLAANVIQIIGFAGDLADRLKWCFDKKEDAPRIVKEVTVTLPLLKQILETAGKHGERTPTDNKTKAAFEERLKVLNQVIKECEKDMIKLDDIIKKVVPKKDAGKRQKIAVAVIGIRQDSRLTRVMGRVKNYVEIIKESTDTDTSVFMVDLMKNVNQKMAESGQVEEVKVVLTQISDQIKKQPEQAKAQFDEVKAILHQMEQRQSEDQPAIKDMLNTILLHVQSNADLSAKVIEQFKEPVENIPTRAVKDFVPRHQLSWEIERLLSPSEIERPATPPTVVLLGMGGQGDLITPLGVS